MDRCEGGRLFHQGLQYKKTIDKQTTSVADPELLPGSGTIVPDTDPAKNERADK